MASYHVLRVFTDASGQHGNELGVFASGGDVPQSKRQAVAADLGFAETVFVDDAERGTIRIFTPGVELPFAGHPAVGTAWLLRELAEEVDVLRPPAGELPVTFDGDVTWVAARPEWSPPFEYVQHPSPGAVDALNAEVAGADGWVYAWAWEDEAGGTVRARSFVAEAGIPEDEATGSAALALCGRLQTPITVRQGRGSIIHARPREAGFAEVGGRVALDGSRGYSVESR